MSDYWKLFQGWNAVDQTMQQRVIDWYNSIHEVPISDLRGKGDPNARVGDQIDAWRHTGIAALLAYEHGYGHTIELGNALEDHYPGTPEENVQDYHNNALGARIGNAARVLGLSEEELGAVLKKAYADGLFIKDAYQPKFKPSADIDIHDGIILRFNNELLLKNGVTIDATQDIDFDDGKASIIGVDTNDEEIEVILDQGNVRRFILPDQEGRLDQDINKKRYASNVTISNMNGHAVPLTATDMGKLQRIVDRGDHSTAKDYQNLLQERGYGFGPCKSRFCCAQSKVG
ncbi:hypothetical protein [Aestuariispira insulae]|uniref:Uncharacterized protein n=1 Tax=Aestuariispira insulae TaxID=1461337 RepID=A0A3D9HRY8_9PROT|nr:hypothetical protein [Aestuariispira insulae]RED52175.1 hypothetical protein DFP90_102193 [Aestuariispira insulae]